MKKVSCVRFEVDFRGQIFKDDAGYFFEDYLVFAAFQISDAKTTHNNIGGSLLRAASWPVSKSAGSFLQEDLKRHNTLPLLAI